MIEMELLGVRIELPTNTPIVLLKEQAPGVRLLPIFIGAPEATAIALALEKAKVPRPMTHDLIKLILEDVGLDVERVIVTNLEDKTFFAELVLQGNGKTRTVECRPSDAIAVAVRFDAPIFVSEAVLDEAGYREGNPASDDDADPDEVVEQFREFIESVSPEDFEKVGPEESET